MNGLGASRLWYGWVHLTSTDLIDSARAHFITAAVRKPGVAPLLWSLRFPWRSQDDREPGRAARRDVMDSREREEGAWVDYFSGRPGVVSAQQRAFAVGVLSDSTPCSTAHRKFPCPVRVLQHALVSFDPLSGVGSHGIVTADTLTKVLQTLTPYHSGISLAPIAVFKTVKAGACGHRVSDAYPRMAVNWLRRSEEKKVHDPWASLQIPVGCFPCYCLVRKFRKLLRNPVGVWGSRLSTQCADHLRTR
nr:hypothetical protein Iba_chr12eCG4700 [Ipomoea batatas]